MYLEKMNFLSACIVNYYRAGKWADVTFVPSSVIRLIIGPWVCIMDLSRQQKLCTHRRRTLLTRTSNAMLLWQPVLTLSPGGSIQDGWWRIPCRCMHTIVKRSSVLLWRYKNNSIIYLPCKGMPCDFFFPHIFFVVLC